MSVNKASRVSYRQHTTQELSSWNSAKSFLFSSESVVILKFDRRPRGWLRRNKLRKWKDCWATNYRIFKWRMREISCDSGEVASFLCLFSCDIPVVNSGHCYFNCCLLVTQKLLKDLITSQNSCRHEWAGWCLPDRVQDISNSCWQNPCSVLAALPLHPADTRALH